MLYTFTESKKMLNYWYNIPYSIRYNYSLNVLGIPSVWIRTINEIAMVISEIKIKTIY